jgi:transcription elongation GreA/GreB family factor
MDRRNNPADHHREHTLKQRVRQLTTDNRTLDERLKAARTNLRFQDRRLADLEAQLANAANI